MGAKHPGFVDHLPCAGPHAKLCTCTTRRVIEDIAAQKAVYDPHITDEGTERLRGMQS